MKTKHINIIVPAAAFGFAVSSANAAFVWTGAAGGNWYAAGNWQSGNVPNANDADDPDTNVYAVGSENEGEIVTFDSETATGALPTAILDNGGDWFGAGWHLSPATHVKNGTINLGNSNEYWIDGLAAIDLEVGDGDMGTSATLNLGKGQLYRHANSGGNGLVIKVNADGIVNQSLNMVMNNNNTTINLNGGQYNVAGTVQNLTSSSGYSISFDALGASFTANFGQDFADIAAVNSELGVSFVDTTATGLTATDNLDGTFTVGLVPEPSTTALLGLGGLALILRRRK